MSRQIDCEVPSQLLVERHPVGLTAGRVQIQKGRPLATDGELGLLASDGNEARTGTGHGKYVVVKVSSLPIKANAQKCRTVGHQRNRAKFADVSPNQVLQVRQTEAS